MKIEGIVSHRRPVAPSETPVEEDPIINAEEIKTILYLGVRGDISTIVDKKHAIDIMA